MGWLSPLPGAVASRLLYRGGHSTLMWLAILSTIGSFWSWGIMHNFAVEEAKRCKSYSGSFTDFTKAEALSVPDGITRVNMLFTLIIVVFLISELVL
jgi:hypothetical protein